MGIDLVAGGRNISHKQRKAPKSQNPYLLLLVKLYRFLSRRTDSKFNKIVLRRLFQSNTNQASMGLGRLAKNMAGETNQGKIAVVVAPITDDVRLLEVPAIKVCALKFTEAARARVLAAGGQCLTFDQLALADPTGENCVLLRGRRGAREACKFFGPSPGARGSHTKPRVRSKGRKFEKSTGR